MMNSSLTNLMQKYKKYMITQNIRYFSIYKFICITPIRVKINGMVSSL